jgi:hypothetical protein
LRPAFPDDYGGTAAAIYPRLVEMLMGIFPAFCHNGMTSRPANQAFDFCAQRVRVTAHRSIHRLW